MFFLQQSACHRGHLIQKVPVERPCKVCSLSCFEAHNQYSRTGVLLKTGNERKDTRARGIPLICAPITERITIDDDHSVVSIIVRYNCSHDERIALQNRRPSLS